VTQTIVTSINTEDFRREIGISQILLADWLGISRDLLAQYETNRRNLWHIFGDFKSTTSLIY